MKRALVLVIVFVSAFANAERYLPQNGESYSYDRRGNLRFGPAAGEAGSVAIHMDDPIIASWATGYKDLAYGTKGYPIDNVWKTPELALGRAVGDSYDVVCLGDGGTITLTFDQGIRNGEGYDFVVFENAVDPGFLELAYVEVSSDGVHFVRFPNFYTGTNYIPSDSNTNLPEYVYNLASKYMQGYGQGFDLSELVFAYEYALTDGESFSQEYIRHLLDNFEYLDLENIGYVRIQDIIGDGSYKDSAGNPIYDPDGCWGSPGFDLDAIGVINERIIAVPESSEYAVLFAFFAVFIIFCKKRNGMGTQ